MRDALERLLREHGQEHLLAFWDELAPEARDQLAAEIREIDLPLIAELHANRDSVENVRDLVDSENVVFAKSALDEYKGLLKAKAADLAAVVVETSEPEAAEETPDAGGEE